MIVVKAGGRVIKNNFEGLINSIVNFITSNQDSKLIFVHGGGDQVTELSKKLGIEPKFVTSPEGIRSRYTTKEELEVFIMAMSFISRQALSKISSYTPAIAITGADGKTVIAERKKKIIIIDDRGRKRIIEGGYTGKIKEVNTTVLSSILSIFNVIIFSPLAYDPQENSLLNVDGDQMAFSIASSLKAESLIILTDVDGVIIDNNVVHHLTVSEAKELVAKVGPGMNRKLLMSTEAVERGVKRVIISNGLVKNAINNALNGNGTVIE
ncbi:[LysW]-aminoadipate/[LysW]-glutamate kinase [Stygiolobus caldivivus]|uniref:[LysW]-aminoadipate/[LysW]-glutamate kinase n=1 Tax=Stygiolobus caldivivus TaxID=2824673 RepID=A0A8D5U728_9CREN|nr:[LysW]-aminoadipate/[LysW]-glutamate kinase [Stygiolobus caldivivus]BCU70519.1 acetylaminoadipate kinase [Stygiolobus caldivivus]